MPLTQALIRFNGQPCLDPLALQADCMAHGWDLRWLDKRPNHFRTFRGKRSGFGYVLVPGTVGRSIGPRLDNLLEFITDGRTIRVENVGVTEAEAIAPRDVPTDDAAYLLKLVDVRHGNRYGDANIGLNIPHPGDGGARVHLPSTYFSGWANLVSQLWSLVGVLGPFRGVIGQYSYPSDQPDNIRWPFVAAYDALNMVLEVLGLEICPRFAGYHVSPTDGPEQAFDDLRLEARNFLIDTRHPREVLHIRAPERVRVCFPARDWTYGGSPTEPTTQDAWQLKPSLVIDDSTGLPNALPGSVMVVWDPMPARYDEDANLLNGSELSYRAAWRSASIGSAYKTVLVHEVYSGAWPFEPGPRCTGVAWFDTGDGLKTEVVAWPGRMLSEGGIPGELVMGAEDLLEVAAMESWSPPDLARAHTPYNRFVWGEVKGSDIEPGKCGKVKVLRGRHQTLSPGTSSGSSPGIAIDWIDTGQEILEVCDFLGTGAGVGQRVLCIFHWQTKTWTFWTPGGGDVQFLAKLLTRSDIWYGWKEAAPHVDTEKCEPDGTLDEIGPRFGLLDNRPGHVEGPAFEINHSSHNSQGGLHALSVFMHHEIISLPECPLPINIYWFDYSGTWEEDTERLIFNPIGSTAAPGGTSPGGTPPSGTPPGG